MQIDELLFTHWGWFILALVLGALEILAPGAFMIWLAGAALVTGCWTLVFGFGWELQLVSFAVLSVASVLVGRAYLRMNPLKSADPSLNRRGDRMVGEVVTVAEAIRDGEGRVQVGDSPWLAALVRDTSLFGATGPILGSRSRLEVSPTWGDLSFTNVVADTRHYVMPFTPLTVAGRFLHIGRYGADSESRRLSPLFVGFPNLVRGYDIGSFDVRDCNFSPGGSCPVVDRLIGSKIVVTGVELRAPLVGLFKGSLEYGPIPADLIAFFDAGVAWDDDSLPSGVDGGTRPWARSVGAGLRVNALGYLILELNAVRALDRGDNRWRFVFGVSPGF